MNLTEKWWCVQSPEYGLLPFTTHTDRRGAIDDFQMHGLSSVDRLTVTKEAVTNGWRTSKREGFKCVRISVREIRRADNCSKSPK